MRSNVKVGRGIISTRSAHNGIVAKGVTFDPAAAQLRKERDAANAASQAASVARYRQSLINKGLISAPVAATVAA